MRFGFIRQQMKAYPVTVLCKVMEVSRSGFYDYLHRLSRSCDNDPAQGMLESRIRLKAGSRQLRLAQDNAKTQS
jgi:hypothetical protein